MNTPSALCNQCGSYVSPGRANGTLYGSQQLVGYYADGEPCIAPVLRLDCYGGASCEARHTVRRATPNLTPSVAGMA